MAKIKETSFQKKLVWILRGRGAMVLNCHGHGMQAAGWPDLYVAHHRWTGWIELKVGKREVTASQGIKIRELRKRGVDAVILRLDEEGVITAENTASARPLKGLDSSTLLDFLQEACNDTNG